MALLFLDTSALAKLYVSEPGTAEMVRLADPKQGHQLMLLGLARVELRSALRRRAHLGDIASADADRVLQDFQQHLASVFQVQPITNAVLDRAEVLIDKHVLRAYDAIQLGGCLTLRQTAGQTIDLRLVASDAILLDVAAKEGLATIDPANP